MFLILIFSYVISSFSLLATNASQMATTITQVTTSDNVLHLRLNNRESIQDQLIKALEENNIEEFQRLWTLYCKNPSEIDFYALALNLENWEIINFLLNQQVSIPCAIITKLLEAAQNNTQILQALMDYKDKNQQTILHQAASSMNHELVDQIITLLPEIINKQDNRGNTALHIILQKSKIDRMSIMDKFKNAGARVDIKNTNNRTAEELLSGFKKHEYTTPKSNNSNNMTLKLKKPISKTKKTKKLKTLPITIDASASSPVPQNIGDNLTYVAHTTNNQNVNFEQLFVCNLEDIEDPFEGTSSYGVGL